MDPFKARLAAIGAGVRNRRLALGLSQREAASRWGVGRAWLGSLERGQLNPSLHALMTLAEGMRIPLSELFAPADEGSRD